MEAGSASVGSKRHRAGGSDSTSDNPDSAPPPPKQVAVADADAAAPLAFARTSHDGAGPTPPRETADMGAVAMTGSPAAMAAPAPVAPAGSGVGAAQAAPAGSSVASATAGAAAAAVPAAAAPEAALPAGVGAQLAAVLVKVGHGKDLVVEHAGLLGMHSGALLETLSESKSFRVKLQGVSLDDCTVLVTASTNEHPTADEWRAAVELKGVKTLRACVSELRTKLLLPAGATLFIHVQLGGAAAAAVDEREHKAEPREKTFTVNGAITPADAGRRFFLPPVVAPLIEHIKKGTFFMLHGTRGAGKTTTAVHALRQVCTARGWLPLTVNMNAVAAGSSETFWPSLSSALHRQGKTLGVSVPSFKCPSSFQEAFSRAVVGDRMRFVLMFDEFDDLDSATVGPRVKDEFLGAMRDIKQNIGEYAIQTAFAVGPFSILFMNGTSGSPFNVREAVPVHMLEEEEVAKLLTEFATAKSVTLEDGIIADVFRLTAGHAGLVCACGRALDTAVPRTHDDTITLASWTDYAVRTLPFVVRDWPTIGKMARSVAGFSPTQAQVLETVLAAGDRDLTARSSAAIEAAQFLAAEGWLRSVGTAASEHVYRIASPLVHGIALAELARKATITEPLPLDADNQLVFPDVITASLRFFKTTVMRFAAEVSSKTSAARVPGAAKRAPSEAAYHAQLASVLGTWLREHADVFTEADSFVQAAGGAGASATALRKKYADILLIGRVEGAPKHVLELVASATDGDIAEHYTRTVAYMAAHDGARGACITFTAMSAASDVASVRPDALHWPAPEQLASGLVAIHVVHDVDWTAAAVHCQKAGDAAIPPQSVALSRA